MYWYVYQFPSNIPHWKQGTRLPRVDAGTTEALGLVQGNPMVVFPTEN